MVLALLASAVALVLVLVIRLDKPEDKTEKPEEVKSLFEVKQDDVNRVEVTRREGGKLAFEKDGQEWRMTAPMECPANKYEVQSLIRAVADLKANRTYAKDNEDRPSDKLAGLDEPAATVTLYEGRKPSAELVLGGAVPTGKGSYFRKSGDETIYESDTPLAGTFTKKPTTYRDKKLITADIKDVQRVKVEGVTGFVLVRDGDNWVIESPVRARADKSRADRVVQQMVSSLYVQDWEDDAPSSYKVYQLDEPRLRVHLETRKQIPPKARPGDPDTQPADIEPSFEEKAYTLLIGGPKDIESKNFFGRMESSPTVFSVGEHVLKALAAPLDELRDKSIAGMDQAKVTKVTAETPGGSMTLTREAGKWSSADGRPVDDAAVEDLIRAVRDLKATNFADPKDSIGTSDWSDPRARVTLVQEGKLDPVTVLVGQPSSSGKMVYVRNASEEGAAIVHEEEIQQLLQPPVSYGNRTVLEFPQDRARMVEIDRAQGPDLTLSRESGTAPWRMTAPVEAAADATAVRNLLQDLASLRAKRVVAVGAGSEYGLDQPQVTLAVHVAPLTADGNTAVVGEGQKEIKIDLGSMKKDGDSDQVSEPEPAPTGDAPASAPASAPTVKDPRKPAYTNEELLEYQRSLGDKENPLMTELLEKLVAEEKAAAASRPAAQEGEATQPAAEPSGGAALPAAMVMSAVLAADEEAAPNNATAPAADDAASAGDASPAEPASTQPQVLRLMLTRKDGVVYAMREGSDLIYELDAKVYDDAVAEMHDRQVAKFEVASVTEIAFGSDSQGVTLRKSGDTWKAVQDPLLPIDTTKVTEALNTFADLKTDHFVAYQADDLAAFGLADDAAGGRVVVSLLDGGKIDLRVAATGPEADADKSRYAVRAGQPGVFLLKPDQADKLQRTLEDFEKKAGGSAPMPAAGPGGGGNFDFGSP